MNLPLISILQLNQAEMSIVLQALTELAFNTEHADPLNTRVNALLERIEDKLPRDDRQE